MIQAFDDYDDMSDFPLRTIDEIWEQWNQSNELSSDTNLPNSVRNRQQDAEVVSVTEVFDSDFKYLYEVPSHMVAHVPSARLNITRLVLCRNYRPCDPDSCAMGANCKFVHVDVDIGRLDAHPIHVNYVWQHEDLCTYRRLQPGEMVEVLSTDSRGVEVIPSERILVTRGAIARHDIVEPLIRCKYYDASQICYTGERCNFVHVVYVDPNVQGLFKRAPKAHMEPRSATSASPIGTNNTTNNPNNTSGSGSGNLSGAGDGGDGGAFKWVPSSASPPFEPSAAAAPHSFQQSPAPPFNSRAAPFVPAPEGGARDAPAAALQELLPLLQAQAQADPAPLAAPQREEEEPVQEKLAHVLSCVASLLTQRAAQRSITVAASPLLEDQSASGTLLFLPRGSSEAVALQSVHDIGILGVVAALGAQKRGGAPAQKSFYPQTTSGATGNQVPNSGGGNSSDLYTKQLLYELQCCLLGLNGNYLA